MPTEAERAQRVANGSRRKRDLVAAGLAQTQQKSATRLANEAWAAEHLPGENHYCVTTARLRLANSGLPVNAETVREWLRDRGWLKEQR